MPKKDTKLSIRQMQDFVYRMKERREEKEEVLTEAPAWLNKLLRGKNLDKNNAGDLEDAIKSIKDEEGANGELYDFYTFDGKRVPYQTFIGLSKDEQLAMIVVDKNGYFIRKGTEVLKGKKVRAKMTLDGKFNADSEENKVSDSHKGVAHTLTGRPADWKYTVKKGDEVKTIDGDKMFGEDGKLIDLKGWTIEVVKDTKNNELKGHDKILTVINRFLSRLADAQKQNAANQATEQGKKVTKTHIWKSKPSDVADGNIPLDKLSASNGLILTQKQFNGLNIAKKRLCYFGIETGGDSARVFSYQQAAANSALKKHFNISESKKVDVDDAMALNESYTVAKKELSYDDEVEGITIDTGYDLNYKIDDTFG
jgi:hypothetical protein